MRRIPLKLRITILCGIILIAVATFLTIVSVQNADNTYTDQFVMKFGDQFSINFDGQNTTFGGKSGEKINDVLDFAKQFIPSEELNDILSVTPHKEAESTGNIFKEAGRKFTLQSILVAVVLVIIGLILIYLITGQALKPVSKLSDTVKRINENNLYEKIEEPVAKDEIASLTTAYNQMLDRLSTSFAIQKNFAANAAHELRTPLATTKAGIQVLEMDEEPSIEDYKEAIEIAKESNERLIQIVDNLLILSKETKDSFSDLILLESLFQELDKELTLVAKDKGITLEMINNAGAMKGNRILMYRAIFNLVENGIKYCGKGGKVTLTSFEKDNFITIIVADNGPGIPAESIDHIFEPFYRVDKSRSKAIGGSGLGLSIVKGIIDKHNGKISVNSKTGEGTIFTIEFESAST
ncbi:HAMP domain-containing histidine kinase [Mobilitalea sibirica]|uniref:histidine kinase n=1 Tax=Mobilitalea sibirica TaxID=1462919 RepID=A0A8J7HA54_9FIRM|nr:HAMP domain-containing sensor histidine kinase [Mobilitalea sibirica]MBH1939626.1 HAMP domain-containing histidine kinase [Mobilitalea sibirica]